MSPARSSPCWSKTASRSSSASRCSSVEPQVSGPALRVQAFRLDCCQPDPAILNPELVSDVSSEFWSPTAVKSRCGSSAPAASWASRRSPSSARPTAAPRTSSWPTKPICVGPAEGGRQLPARSTSMISAAEVGNVQAIHPGYGFLSENAHFNEVCRSCNIDFIGPTPEAMARLGDKNAARELAREAERARRARQRGPDRRRRRSAASSPTRSAFRC